MSQELKTSLATECLDRQQTKMLVQAGTGRAQSARQDSGQSIIRGDQIAWLHAGVSLACDAYLQIMDQVRVLLNQSLYLGLVDFESHFSYYAPGTFYRAHVDRFHHDDTRMISIVIYLNDDWLSEQGGALRLHPKSLPSLDIAPVACRLVVFLSAEMLHEVMPATRERMSLTGWFRRRQLR